MMVHERSFFPATLGQAQTFYWPELFPAQTRLLLNTRTSTAILVRLEEADLAATHPSFQLTPSATLVFEALLQAYPSYCSYHTLFEALFPLPQERAHRRAWERELALRPIRRALASLNPVLSDLGLQAVSLRMMGYVLAPLSLANHAALVALRRKYSTGPVTSSPL